MQEAECKESRKKTNLRKMFQEVLLRKILFASALCLSLFLISSSQTGEFSIWLIIVYYISQLTGNDRNAKIGSGKVQ